MLTARVLSRVSRALRHASTASAASALPLHAIVKVTAVCAAPNYYLPWQRKATRESSGSGFLLAHAAGAAPVLVTNAHVVADASYISVRRARSAASHRARVLALSHESDLALLGVDDARFWAEERGAGAALALGELPALQEHVNVLGFPTGGEGVSVTRGVVSRIEPIQYAHGSIHLLGVQIDASINPGNSGGPALYESERGAGPRVAGVAFQSLVGAENIGYVVPPPVIAHFLTQYHAHRRYSGFPQMGLQYQTLENASQRRALNLGDGDHGVLITRVAPVSPAHAVLRRGDVLCALDGHAVADNGSVHFRDGERLYLNYLLVHKFVGDTCVADILRDGQRMQVAFALASSSDLALVPAKPLGAPAYLVYGGLVFTRLTLPYLQEFSQAADEGESWYDAAPRALVHKATTELRKFADEEVVILSHVLPDDLNAGYTHFANLELKSFNGTPVTSVRALHRALQANSDAFARFTFADDVTIILETDLVKRKARDILDFYGIPAAHSPDLVEPK